MTYIKSLLLNTGLQIQGIRPDRVPEELWVEVNNIVQEDVIKNIPKKKKCKRQND